MSDAVNHPAHYGGADNPYEAIKVIEAWALGFNLGNAVKYISRAGKKDARLQDLKKAAWYLQREIASQESVAAAPQWCCRKGEILRVKVCPECAEASDAAPPPPARVTTAVPAVPRSTELAISQALFEALGRPSDWAGIEDADMRLIVALARASDGGQR